MSACTPTSFVKIRSNLTDIMGYLDLTFWPPEDTTIFFSYFSVSKLLPNAIGAEGRQYIFVCYNRCKQTLLHYKLQPDDCNLTK